MAAPTEDNSDGGEIKEIRNMSDSDESDACRVGLTKASYTRDVYNQSPDLFDDSSNEVKKHTKKSVPMKKRISKIHHMSDSGSDSGDSSKAYKNGLGNSQNKKSSSKSPQKASRVEFLDNFMEMSASGSDGEDDTQQKIVHHKKSKSMSQSMSKTKSTSKSKLDSSSQKPHKKDYSKPMQTKVSGKPDSSKSRMDKNTHKNSAEQKSSPVSLKKSAEQKSSPVSLKNSAEQKSSPVSLKRKHSSSSVSKELRKLATEVITENENSSAKKTLPACKYGSECYRKNPSHLKEYSHEKKVKPEKRKHSSSPPPRKKLKSSPPPQEAGSSRDATSAPARSVKPSISAAVGPPKSVRPSSSAVVGPPKSVKPSSTAVVGPPKSVRDRVEQAQPYSFFLTKVAGIADKHNNSMAMDIKDILSPEMGNLTASCQFNFMFDISWLMKQYPPQFRSKPLLIVHGEQGPSKNALQSQAMTYSNIKFCQAKLEMMYGTHHTKMMFLMYDTGLRVVIHTSNLVSHDWHQKTQGMWISPVFPRLATPGKDKGDSPTHFKRDLLTYMAAYKAYQLKEWQEHIERHDMSAAKVVIIASVPGRHAGEQAKSMWGHLKLRKVLQQHGPSEATVKSWPVIGQFSSIGSMGPTKESWVCGEFVQSLSAVKSGSGMQSSTRIQLVFPSKDNVRLSLEGFPAGGSIPYSIHTAKKQTYLHQLFHVWKSEGRGRSGAMPHIKTYIRPKQDGTKAAWFLVTSANLSKAAWGALEKKGVQLMIRSYELGVLLLPKFLDDAETFEVTTDVEHARSTKTLALPYDLPAQAYTHKDRPWMWDIPYMDLPDTNGNVWCPFSK